MKLHREGRRMILLWILIAALILTGIYFLLLIQGNWFIVLAVFTLVLLGLLVWFFRLPFRSFGEDTSCVYSPVDGKIVVIEQVFEGEYFMDKRIQVSIFMSPLNPHVNYVPISGKVAYFRYHPGKYLFAFHPKSSAMNERTSIALVNERGRGLLMRQIAGAVARRIVWYCSEGQQFKAGEQIGFIKFGSRIDLLLPEDAIIDVKLDQVVRAGVSVIARDV